MDDQNLYTGFSNYQEVNSEGREKAMADEIKSWGKDSDRFIQYRREWKKAAEENHLPDHPLHVDIELADVCNLRCEMCAHGMGTVNKTGFMDKDLTFKLIKEASLIGVYSIKFNWRGEAALNQLLPEAIRYAKECGILEVAINTNALPKRKDILIKAAEAGLDRIIFSIDGFSAETYESIRIGGNYLQLMENVSNFLEWKKATASCKPFVRVQMVRSNKNAHEVEAFVDYWKDRVDDVRISDVMDRGQGGHLSIGEQTTVGRRRCPQPFQRLTIGRDGRVSPCCADWNQMYVIGDVKESSLLEIWNSHIMSKMRDVQNSGALDTLDVCRGCYVKESFLWNKNEE